MTTEKAEERSADTKGPLSVAETPDHELSVFPHSASLFADGMEMQKLHASLDAIADAYGQGPETDGKIPLNRPNIVAFLNCLYLGIRPNLVRAANLVYSAEDEPKVVLDHPAMVLLRDFIDALEDLDNAKTAPVFNSAQNSKGAALKRSEMRRRDELLTLVEVVQSVYGLKNRAAAEKSVHEMMGKTLKRAGVPPTAKALREMRKTRSRQRRRIKNS